MCSTKENHTPVLKAAQAGTKLRKEMDNFVDALMPLNPQAHIIDQLADAIGKAIDEALELSITDYNAQPGPLAGDELAHPCTDCGDMFPTVISLRDHWQSTHSANPGFKAHGHSMGGAA